MTETKNKGWWEKGVDATADSLGYLIVRLSPLVGAFPSIGTIVNSAENKGVAIFLVLGIELVGYALGDAAVKSFEKKVLPSRHIQIAIGIYLACIEGLMLGYSVIPAWSAWYAGTASFAAAVQASASIIYPFFTLAGAGLYAFHQYIGRMTEEEKERKAVEKAEVESVKAKALANTALESEIEIERKRAELEAYKERLRQDTSARYAAKMAKIGATVPQKESKPEKPKADGDRSLQLAALDAFKANPSLSDANLAQAIGCSKRKAQGLVVDLEALGVIEVEKLTKGKIVTLNGNSEAFLKGEL